MLALDEILLTFSTIYYRTIGGVEKIHYPNTISVGNFMTNAVNFIQR
ncbi:11484_t:CDS:2 [Funneliformis caledonium]|uniref:11484_t:CDS:1 n=1 Tax=Funneliformis caledonium TaxID=1117310 RepID=A0A9N9ANR3_9GLOM|nr:11484_t:CDS:2 [Funneliformis caledonium]